MCGGLQSGWSIFLVPAKHSNNYTDLMLECTRQFGHSKLGAELSQNHVLTEPLPFNNYKLGRRAEGKEEEPYPTFCI